MDEKAAFPSIANKTETRQKKLLVKKYSCLSVKNNQPTSTMGIFLEICIIVEN
jgi:hypothetical protein